MILEHGRWLVPTENSDKHRKMMREIYANIRSNPDKFSHMRSSRFYTFVSKENSRFETWIYLDEYQDQDSYDRMSKALTEDKRAAELRARWEALIVPSSFKVEVWTDFASELWLENRGSRCIRFGSIL